MSSSSTTSVQKGEQTDDFIKEYMKKSFPSYPEYWNNIILGKEILKKVNTKKEVVSKKSNPVTTDGFIRKLVSECNANEKVEIEGVISDIRETRSYTGCPVCWKKVCDRHKETPVTVSVYKFVVTSVDNHDIETSYFSLDTNYNKLSKSDSVRIRGVTKVFENKITLAASMEPTVINKQEVQKKDATIIINELKRVGSMRKRVLESLLEMNALSWSDIENDVVEIDKGGGVISVSLKE